MSVGSITPQFRVTRKHFNSRLSPNATDCLLLSSISSGSEPSTSSTVTDTRGTKAAIALAIILSFLLISLLLAYVFIYRPRKRRKALAQRSQRRLEKEAEAGASVLDISTEGRDIAEKRTSRGTSFGFAGFRFGRGSQRSASEEIEIDSNGSWNSSKRGRRTRDPHSQWESYTVDLPPTSYGGSRPHSYGQHSPTEGPAIPLSSRISRSPRSSYGSRPSHVRLGSGALLLNNTPGQEDDEDAEIKSNHSIDSGYGGAVEMFLSPRTSEAVFVAAESPPKHTPVDVQDNTGESIPPTSGINRSSRDARFLNVAAGSPFKVDFTGASGSRRSSARTKRKSALSRTEPTQPEQSTAASKPKPAQEEQRGDPPSATRVSQVKFGSNTLEPPSSFSFLDFSSSTASSSDMSKASSRSSSKRSEVDKSHLSTAAASSQIASVRRPERISNPRSVSFDVPSSGSGSSSSQSQPQSTSFPYPMTLHVMPSPSPQPEQQQQVPSSSTSNPPQRTNTNSRRLSVGPMGPRPLSTTHNTLTVTAPTFPSSRNNSSDSDSVTSPTDSLPMTVSDIHFRTMDSSSEPGSRRTSSGSQLPPHPPLPGTVTVPGGLTPVPELLTPPPKIVQKLLGMNQPSGSLLAGGSGSTPSPGHSRGPSHDYIQSRPALPRTESSTSMTVPGPGSTPSTPFMQRMLEIGSAVLTPRHGHDRTHSRNQSQSQSQSQDPSGSASDILGPSLGRQR